MDALLALRAAPAFGDIYPGMSPATFDRTTPEIADQEATAASDQTGVSNQVAPGASYNIWAGLLAMVVVLVIFHFA
jgi:hypothetical protein